MSEITREDAEALVDGLTFTCAPVLAQFAAKPQMLAMAADLEERYNAMLRDNREAMIETLMLSNPETSP